MSEIGPELPPHLLAKRKRRLNENLEDVSGAASGAASGAKPDSSAQEEGGKRRRVIGPALPLEIIEQRAAETPDTVDEDSSDDDDGFGPAPVVNGAMPAMPDKVETQKSEAYEAADSAAEQRMKRDDWMTVPPKQDDLSARMDPNIRRPQGFSTGKGARGSRALGNSDLSWHETPEQKQRRLQNEIMGIAEPCVPGGKEDSRARKASEAEAVRRKVLEHSEKRGRSLLEQHQQNKGADAEDDPSKRAFDREKDMGGSSRVTSSQKREMLHEAQGFSSKFTRGSFL